MGEGKHSRFTVRSPAGRARAVAFDTGGRLGVAEGEPAEATFALEVNEWNGVSEPRLVLRHARPLAGEQTATAGGGGRGGGARAVLCLRLVNAAPVPYPVTMALPETRMAPQP